MRSTAIKAPQEVSSVTQEIQAPSVDVNGAKYTTLDGALDAVRAAWSVAKRPGVEAQLAAARARGERPDTAPPPEDLPNLAGQA